jgi:hypothetical protein
MILFQYQFNILWHVKEPSLLKAMSDKHRYKFAAVQENQCRQGGSSRLAMSKHAQIYLNVIDDDHYFIP